MEVTPREIRAFLNSHTRVQNTDTGLVRAGVMLLFYLRSGELHILLTKRTNDVEHHKSQISFPGGSADEKDADIIQTALRETKEEIGIPLEKIEVLGLFDDVWTPSGFRITPVIGYLHSPPKLAINNSEVEEVLEVPVSFFLDEKNARVKTMMKNGRSIDVYFYQYGANDIWGATAGMLRSFLAAFRKYVSVGGTGASSRHARK